MFCLLCLLYRTWFIPRSGRAVMSTRDNRIAAESVGINVTKYKLLAFTVSAALAGVAGVLYAHNTSDAHGISI